MCPEFLTILDVLSKIGGLIFGVFAMGSVVVAYRQYDESKSETRRLNAYASKAKACELAKYYAEAIIPCVNIVYYVYNSTEKSKGFTSSTVFPPHLLKEFDTNEMSKFLSRVSPNSHKIIEMEDGIDPRTILDIKLLRAKDMEEYRRIYNQYGVLYQAEPTDEQMKEISTLHTLLMNDFYSTVGELLNHLEWFSMNFRYNIADETVVYQSLHQTFLSSMSSLYVNIAKLNEHNTDKYYTNAIWLYNTWNDRLREQTGKYIAAQEAAIIPPFSSDPVE